MTEGEWRASDVPSLMLASFEGQADPRKLRLFAVAVCRLKSTYAAHPTSAVGVGVSERFADGLATDDELRSARRVVQVDWSAVHDEGQRNADWSRNASLGAAYQVTRPDAYKVVAEVMMLANNRHDGVDRATQAALIRCIFGNPFRPVAFDPGWRTEAVAGLARGIYDDRAFDRLMVLADALEGASCTDAAILAHCRGDGPHARGCWVIDAVLGKGDMNIPSRRRDT